MLLSAAAAGFIAGALMWICNAASSGAVASALFLQVARAWPQLEQPLWRTLFMVALYAALITLNAFGVRLGTRAINILLEFSRHLDKLPSSMRPQIRQKQKPSSRKISAKRMRR